MVALQEKFNQNIDLLGPFETKPHIAIAVSGGSDSLALTFLLHQWIQEKAGTLTALIVNHQLRPEAEQEAESVAELLKGFHIPTFILKNDNKIIKRRLQEEARSLRYDLLKGWCYQNGVLHLCIGHHQDDQRETFLMRQAKKSSDLGLSGMSCLVETPYVRLLRPLLNFTKQELRQYLAKKRIAYIEDPSNLNLKYRRAVLRQYFLSQKDKKNIHQILQEKGKQRIIQEHYINTLVSKCVQVFEYGYGILHKAAFKELSLQDQIYVLQRCLMTFGRGHYPASQESIKRLIATWDVNRTLKGCMILYFRDTVYIFPELNRSYSNKQLQTLLNDSWEDRWKIIRPLDTSRVSIKYLTIGPLQEEGWRQIKNTRIAEKLHSLPSLLRFGLPSLWDQKKEKVLLNSVCSKFTNSTNYGIHFIPRYPLTRFIFKKFN